MRTIREQAGLSMEALAAQAGVATSTVYRIETGRVEPSSGALVRIASVLGVTIDDLIVHEPEATQNLTEREEVSLKATAAGRQ